MLFNLRRGDPVHIRERGQLERVTFDNYDNCGTTAWVKLKDGSHHEVALDALVPIVVKSAKTLG